MVIEGEKLIKLLKHDASIHIIDTELEVDYYGTVELSEEEQAAGAPAGALSVRLDIPADKFIDTPPARSCFSLSPHRRRLRLPLCRCLSCSLPAARHDLVS